MNSPKLRRRPGTPNPLDLPIIIPTIFVNIVDSALTAPFMVQM